MKSQTINSKLQTNLNYQNFKFKMFRILNIGIWSLFGIWVLGFGFSSLAFASEVDGTIISGGNAGYAWSSNAGWVNFAATNGNIYITDSGITGYAWNNNYGWINMAPTNGGVLVAASGALSGNAWGEGLGWINFSGVSINSSGKFTGQATGTVVGTLAFDCDNCSVTTDYRPQSFRTTTTPPAVSGGGGGGGLPPEAYNNPISPEGGFKVIINDNAEKSNSINIIVTLKGGSNTSNVWISEFPDFPENKRIEYLSSQSEISANHILSDGEGVKTIYAKFCTQWGRCSESFYDTIIYSKQIVPGEIGAPSAVEGEEAIPAETLSPVGGEQSPVSIPATTEEAAEPTAEIAPEQLFDINIEIENSEIADIKDLVARVIFTSFGRVPTPVDLTFDILDSVGEKIYSKTDKITVQTQSVLTERFDEMDKILETGGYTLLVTTLYNVDVKDEFRQGFEIVSQAGAKKPFWKFWWFWVLSTLGLIIIFFIILKRRKDDEDEEEEEIKNTDERNF